MCLQLSRTCSCGRHSAFLNFRDNLLPPEMLLGLYCPECRRRADFSENTVEDCGWVLEYDLEGARAILAQRGVRGEVTAAFLLEEGYLSWQGLSPGDHAVNAELHHRLAPLVDQDMKQYLQCLKEEWLAYVARLKAEGWRKAQRT
ncbi:MAG: hypothetical protein FJ128_09975 [Deltaproteobacteria bacterium]|nr:hypothetical protein [Deltaproteobacteria bacterium]